MPVVLDLLIATRVEALLAEPNTVLVTDYYVGAPAEAFDEALAILNGK